jgi:hypothetical protein
MSAPCRRFRGEEAMARSRQRGIVCLEHNSWVRYMTSQCDLGGADGRAENGGGVLKFEKFGTLWYGGNFGIACKLLAGKAWALNSAVECHLHTVEVIGSNPIAPTIELEW